MRGPIGSPEGAGHGGRARHSEGEGSRESGGLKRRKIKKRYIEKIIKGRE